MTARFTFRLEWFVRAMAGMRTRVAAEAISCRRSSTLSSLVFSACSFCIRLDVMTIVPAACRTGRERG